MERCNISPAIKTLFALTPALIFITHPVETQAVTYITQRFASLATLFYLLSFVLYVKWRVSQVGLKSAGLYVSSLLAAVLAMKTKEISFTLPFVLVMYELFFFNERSFKERIYPLVPFFLILLIIPLSLFLDRGACNPLTIPVPCNPVQGNSYLYKASFAASKPERRL
jgi:hypothetical protein